MGNSLRLPPGDSYEGDMERGMMHGQGVYTKADGTVFKGTFEKNESCGPGEAIFTPDDPYGRDKFTGEFKGNGLANGTLWYKNDDIYAGMIKHGLPHGMGKMDFANGNSYEGQFVEGKREGEGLLCDFGSGEVYQGLWKDGKYHKEGVITYKDDYMGRLRYVGGFKEGKKSGHGTCEYINNSYYKGEFQEDKYHGNGELRSENGNIFRGEFSNGFKTYGELQYANGSVYVGEFLKHKRHGKGRFEYVDRHIYVGQWVDGKRNGEGVLQFPNGDEFRGGFLNDSWGDGFGVFLYSDGSVYEGEWKDGERHGKGEFKYTNGNVYSGIWMNDKQNGEGTFKYVSDPEGRAIDPPEDFEGIWSNGEVVQEEMGLILAALKVSRTRVLHAKEMAKMEIKKLREQYKGYGNLCLVCTDNAINTIFLECAHCVCCHQCAFDQKRCPKCQKQVTRAVRTFTT